MQYVSVQCRQHRSVGMDVPPEHKDPAFIGCMFACFRFFPVSVCVRMHVHELIRCWLWVPLCAFVAVASALVGVATPVISGTGTVTPPLLHVAFCACSCHGYVQSIKETVHGGNLSGRARSASIFHTAGPTVAMCCCDSFLGQLLPRPGCLQKLTTGLIRAHQVSCQQQNPLYAGLPGSSTSWYA
jgi:hypothetical protein